MTIIFAFVNWGYNVMNNKQLINRNLAFNHQMVESNRITPKEFCEGASFVE